MTAQVKIKPLDWEDHGGASVAVAPLFGSLRVYPYGKNKKWVSNWAAPFFSDTFCEGEWETLEAAKVATQAEYEARMLAAIEITQEPRTPARDILADLTEAEAEHLLILRAMYGPLSGPMRAVLMKALGITSQPESPDAGRPYFDGMKER